MVKNLPADAGDVKRHGFDPWVGKTPWRREWQPTPVFLPREYHGQRSRWATVHGVTKSQPWLKWLRTYNGKKPACQRRRHMFDSWVRKIPWSRKWQPTPVFVPGKLHGERSLLGYSPWGCKRVRHHLVTKQRWTSINFTYRLLLNTWKDHTKGLF